MIRLVVLSAIMFGNSSVFAREQYFEVFQKKYHELAVSGSNLERNRCNNCHMPKRKKVMTRYMDLLFSAVESRKNIKDKALIDAALSAIETEESLLEEKSYLDLMNEGRSPNEENICDRRYRQKCTPPRLKEIWDRFFFGF